jgi:hypothetical protein
MTRQKLKLHLKIFFKCKMALSQKVPVVFLVKEMENQKIISINLFLSIESARQYILRQIGEFKANFLTSTYGLQVETLGNIYKIKSYKTMFYFFYLEYELKTFEISEEIVKF